MRRAIIGLFVIFSLMLAPVAHAAEANCMKADCVSVDHQSGKQKQDDGKTGKVAHDCCAHHVADRTVYRSVAYAPSASQRVVFVQQDDLPSIVVGPLLEPPAHV